MRKVGCRLPAQGYILTHVFTSRANLPLANATVSVTEKTVGGQDSIISLQLTDTSGNTQSINIATPPAADSQSPNRPKGFTVVDIAVDLPDYERVLVENVQVFPDTITLQDVQLLPHEALPAERGQTQVVFVTPQNL